MNLVACFCNYYISKTSLKQVTLEYYDEAPAAIKKQRGLHFGLERREVEKRRKDQRLTASAVFHEYKIISDYDRGIKELRTILGESMNYLEASFLR